MKLSRREAIKTAAVGVGAVAASAVLPALPASPPDTLWGYPVEMAGGFLVPRELEQSILALKDRGVIFGDFRRYAPRPVYKLVERTSYEQDAIMKRLAHAYLRAEERLT